MFLSTVTNKSSITDTTVRSLTEFGYFSCSIHQDIWYFMSNNPDLCLENLKVTSRKKGRFSGMALIGLFSAGWILEYEYMIWFKSNCLKNPCIKNGPIWASSKNLPFFLDVISQLFQHISGLCDIKYQMTWCAEHEKYPNYVRMCTRGPTNKMNFEKVMLQ